MRWCTWAFPCSPPRCPQERSSSESAAETEAHVHGSLAVSPVQFETLLQCSPLVTFQRKFRLEVFSDKSAVRLSVKCDSLFFS